MHTQEAVKRAVEQHGRDALIVLLGSPDPESAAIAAETVVRGDPTYAGPLAGVPLGLPVYHVLEAEVRAAVPPDVYEQQVGVMDTVLDQAQISECVRRVRESTT